MEEWKTGRGLKHLRVHRRQVSCDWKLRFLVRHELGLATMPGWLLPQIRLEFHCGGPPPGRLACIAVRVRL